MLLCELRQTQKYTLGEERGSLNIKSGGTYSDHWAYGIEAFKGERR